MPIEMTITVRDESITHKEKHLLYDPISLSKDSHELALLVDKAVGNFSGNILEADITIKTRMNW